MMTNLQAFILQLQTQERNYTSPNLVIRIPIEYNTQLFRK